MKIKRIINEKLNHIFIGVHRRKIGDAVDFSELLEQYKFFIASNREVVYSFDEINTCISKTAHSFVGAAFYDNSIFFTPNDYPSIYKVNDSMQGIFIGDFGNRLYKFSGQCCFDNNLILFPRSSDYFVLLNLEDGTIEKIPNGEAGLCERYYGGVCTRNGVVFQPPRDNNRIIMFDIKNRSIRKVKIGFSRSKYRYCGSVLHPNGFIYFLPEDGHVIKLNPENGRWSFIGNHVSGKVYDAKVAVDGNIYGFSGYGKGILSIDVEKDEVCYIFKDTYFGSYGTKVGINGKMYSIPGNSNVVWEFDPVNTLVRCVHVIENDKWGTKFAGGAISLHGTIYASPVRTSNILRYSPSVNNIIIPKALFDAFFSDSY